MYNDSVMTTISVEYQGEWPIYGDVVGVVPVPYTDVYPGMSLTIEFGRCVTNLQIKNIVKHLWLIASLSRDVIMNEENGNITTEPAHEKTYNVRTAKTQISLRMRAG